MNSLTKLKLYKLKKSIIENLPVPHSKYTVKDFKIMSIYRKLEQIRIHIRYFDTIYNISGSMYFVCKKNLSSTKKLYELLLEYYELTY